MFLFESVELTPSQLARNSESPRTVTVLSKNVIFLFPRNADSINGDGWHIASLVYPNVSLMLMLYDKYIGKPQILDYWKLFIEHRNFIEYLF